MKIVTIQEQPKYNDLCTKVREKNSADTVVLMVARQGRRGGGLLQCIYFKIRTPHQVRTLTAARIQGQCFGLLRNRLNGGRRKEIHTVTSGPRRGVSTELVRSQVRTDI